MKFNIDSNITIAKHDNFYLICNSYNPTTVYYLGYVEKNQIKFTQGLRLNTSPITFKNLINANDYKGIDEINNKKKKSQKERNLIFLHSQIESRTNGNAEKILIELLTVLGDIAEELEGMGNSTINEGIIKRITNETVIKKLNDLSEEISIVKNSKLYLANAGKKGKIVQITNNQTLKDGLYYETEIYNQKTDSYNIDYTLIGNLLIHNLTLTYDKLKLFNPVATIKYTNTTTQQVVTIKKQPYEAIAKNLINNRLIDSNSLGIENLLNKIWVQGVNNHDFITAETDLLKDGFFMDMEINKVLSNNVFENLETSKDDVKKAVNLLDELIRGRGNAVKWDCTLFRFMLWSPFAYCLKQLGFTDDLYSMVLWGESDTNKTGSSVMFSKLYTDNDPLEEKANTQSAIGTMLGENTFPLILDEAKDNLENPNDEEFNKNIVTDKIGRAVKDRTNNNLMVTFPALRLTVRTLNKNLTDIYKGEFYKRHKVLHYDLSMKLTEDDKKKFNKRFKPKSPNTPLKQLRHLGKAFADRFIPYLESESDKLYNLEKLTIEILEQIENDFQVSFNQQFKMIAKITTQSTDKASIIRNALNKKLRNSYKLPYGRDEFYISDFEICIKQGIISWLDYQPTNHLFLIRATEFEKEIQNITGEYMEIRSIMELLNIRYDDNNGKKIKFNTTKTSYKAIKVMEYYLTYGVFNIIVKEFEDIKAEAEEIEMEKEEKKKKMEEEFNKIANAKSI